MYGLEDSGGQFAEARRGSDTETAAASCGDVRKDVAERVLGQDHVELSRIEHELADQLERAVDAALGTAPTRDVGGTATTAEFTDTVLSVGSW